MARKHIVMVRLDDDEYSKLLEIAKRMKIKAVSTALRMLLVRSRS